MIDNMHLNTNVISHIYVCVCVCCVVLCMCVWIVCVINADDAVRARPPQMKAQRPSARPSARMYVI